MLETLAFRQLLRCVLHATMSTSFIVRVPVQNPCSPNGRPGHCKNHNTPSLKNVHLKNGGSVPCKACFAGSWFPYFYFTYCLGWTFFSVKRSVKESVCNCTPSYTELQMVLWWISIVLQSYDVWICLVLLTLALGTAEWFILGVGIYIYIYTVRTTQETLASYWEPQQFAVLMSSFWLTIEIRPPILCDQIAPGRFSHTSFGGTKIQAQRELFHCEKMPWLTIATVAII